MPTQEHEGRSDAGQYGDFVAMVDAEVGKLLEAVDRQGLAASTIVVFTSDNGPYWRPEHVEQFGHRAAGPLRGQKSDAWEGGHRVPFLVRWPGVVQPGAVCPQATSLTNWMATMADVLGVALGSGDAEDSRSILPALQGCREASPGGDDPIVHHSGAGVFAVRQGDWKLVEGLGSGGFSEPRSVEPEAGDPPGQLYHLGRDLGETKNLYLEEPDVAQSLLELLDEIRAPRPAP